jgi:hypothetical protein
MKGLMKSHVLNCDDWSLYAEEYHPYFSVDFCEYDEELYEYLPHSMIYEIDFYKGRKNVRQRDIN